MKFIGRTKQDIEIPLFREAYPIRDVENRRHERLTTYYEEINKELTRRIAWTLHKKYKGRQWCFSAHDGSQFTYTAGEKHHQDSQKRCGFLNRDGMVHSVLSLGRLCDELGYLYSTFTK